MSNQLSNQFSQVEVTAVNFVSALEFEDHGRIFLEAALKTKLPKKLIPRTKTWDYVSADCSIVGDAKRFVFGRPTSGEEAIISSHVWMLEKIPAKVKFLLFGGNRGIPLNWLRRWRTLLADNFLFLFLEKESLQLLYGPNRDLRSVWDSVTTDSGRWKG